MAVVKWMDKDIPKTLYEKGFDVLGKSEEKMEVSHKNEQYRYRQHLLFFLFLHYSSCTLCITASLPLPLFLSLMFLFLSFYCHEPFLFPSSPFSSVREIQAVPCVKELGLSNNRSFYWIFCELSGCVCV